MAAECDDSDIGHFVENLTVHFQTQAAECLIRPFEKDDREENLARRRKLDLYFLRFSLLKFFSVEACEYVFFKPGLIFCRCRPQADGSGIILSGYGPVTFKIVGKIELRSVRSDIDRE